MAREHLTQTVLIKVRMSLKYVLFDISIAMPSYKWPIVWSVGDQALINYHFLGENADDRTEV